jgi:hypothetical protein
VKPKKISKNFHKSSSTTVILTQSFYFIEARLIEVLDDKFTEKCDIPSTMKPIQSNMVLDWFFDTRYWKMGDWIALSISSWGPLKIQTTLNPQSSLCRYISFKDNCYLLL